VFCRTAPKHPKSNSKGLYPLHRVLVENRLGRLLRSNEVVHHLDGVKDNNTDDNLMVTTHSDHSRRHREQTAPLRVEVKCVCGKSFSLKPHQYRLRLKRNKTGKVYCSRSCGARV
jgi:hypothetical protein